MQTIYEPKGKAKEYGELALNIYTGCTHECTYCYAPSVVHKYRDDFYHYVSPRAGIVNAVKERLSKGDIKGKEIFLCFTCDPFPMGRDHDCTFEIIREIKISGNNVAILTKGDPDKRLFDLLDNNDRFGVTISCGNNRGMIEEPKAAPVIVRLSNLVEAKRRGIKTFVSCEPVIDADFIYFLIKDADYVDKFRIGKMNYHQSHINWKEFGKTCEKLCKQHGRNYLIKEGLRDEMER